MSDEQSIRDELDQIVRDADGHWPEMRDAIIPVIRRIQAEAIRDAVGYVRASEWWHESTNINFSDRVRGFLHDRADAIERGETA